MDLNLRVPFVYWYPEGDITQRPAIAASTKECGNGVRHITFVAGNRVGTMRAGVRHHSDERNARMPEQVREDGVWDYTDETKELFALREQLKSLTAPKGKAN